MGRDDSRHVREAERCAGEMLAGLEMRPGPSGNGDTLSLTALGIERHQSSRWQRARWYETRVKIEELAAKERIAANQPKPGETVPKTPKNSGQVQNVPSLRTGKAKDIAASDVGIDKRTADKAVAVVHKIDELEEAGDEKAGLKQNRQTAAENFRSGETAGKSSKTGKSKNTQEKISRSVSGRAKDVAAADAGMSHKTAEEMGPIGSQNDPTLTPGAG